MILNKTFTSKRKKDKRNNPNKLECMSLTINYAINAI